MSFGCDYMYYALYTSPIILLSHTSSQEGSGDFAVEALHMFIDLMIVTMASKLVTSKLFGQDSLCL